MTTANLHFSDFIVDREPARASTEGRRQGDPLPLVVNPFVRRPLKPLTRRERLGVLVIFAFLATFVTTVVVRADQAWKDARQGSTETTRP